MISYPRDLQAHLKEGTIVSLCGFMISVSMTYVSMYLSVWLSRIKENWKNHICKITVLYQEVFTFNQLSLENYGILPLCMLSIKGAVVMSPSYIYVVFQVPRRGISDTFPSLKLV